MRIIVAETQEEKILSYRLRYRIYCQELGWLPADQKSYALEHDEFDEKRSIIFLAITDSGEPIGTSRLILPGNSPLPIEAHFDLDRLRDIESIYGKTSYGVEVSRFIVLKNGEAKEHEITLMLCKAMINTCLRSGVSHMFLSADQRFFRLLRMLGFCIYDIGNSAFFMGSRTVPGVLPLGALHEIKRKKPALYEYLTVSTEHRSSVAVA